MKESVFAAHDIIGLIGVAVILLAYVLLQTERIESNGFIYSFLNALGAVLIISSLLVEWNLAAFTMEATWLVVSIYGISKWLKGRKSPS